MWARVGRRKKEKDTRKWSAMGGPSSIVSNPLLDNDMGAARRPLYQLINITSHILLQLCKHKAWAINEQTGQLARQSLQSLSANSAAPPLGDRWNSVSKVTRRLDKERLTEFYSKLAEFCAKSLSSAKKLCEFQPAWHKSDK